MKTLCITQTEARRLLDAGEVMIVRAMKPQPIGDIDNLGDCETVIDSEDNYIKSPFGKPGDLISLREAWHFSNDNDPFLAFYKADNPDLKRLRKEFYSDVLVWMSPATMPSVCIRPAFRACPVVSVECKPVSEITDDEIESTGTQVVPIKSLGWTSDTSLLAGFYQNWTRRYGKLHPWDEAHAWFAKLKIGGQFENA